MGRRTRALTPPSRSTGGVGHRPTSPSVGSERGRTAGSPRVQPVSRRTRSKTPTGSSARAANPLKRYLEEEAESSDGDSAGEYAPDAEMSGRGKRRRASGRAASAAPVDALAASRQPPHTSARQISPATRASAAPGSSPAVASAPRKRGRPRKIDSLAGGASVQQQAASLAAVSPAAETPALASLTASPPSSSSGSATAAAACLTPPGKRKRGRPRKYDGPASPTGSQGEAGAPAADPEPTPSIDRGQTDPATPFSASKHLSTKRGAAGVGKRGQQQAGRGKRANDDSDQEATSGSGKSSSESASDSEYGTSHASAGGQSSEDDADSIWTAATRQRGGQDATGLQQRGRESFSRDIATGAGQDRESSADLDQEVPPELLEYCARKSPVVPDARAMAAPILQPSADNLLECVRQLQREIERLQPAVTAPLTPPRTPRSSVRCSRCSDTDETDSEEDPEIQDYLMDGLSERSRKTYEVSLRSYERFVRSHDKPGRETRLYPPRQKRLAGWVISLAKTVSHSTIKRYLAGLQSHLIDIDISSDIISPRIQRILRGVRKRHGTKPPKQAAPITLPVLRKINSKLLKSTPQKGDDSNLVFAACYALAFGIFARMGELTYQEFNARVHLTKGDVDLARATIRIKVSKTDQYGATVLLPIPDTPDVIVSPLALLRRVLASPRLRNAPDEAPLFALGNKPFRKEDVLKRLREVIPKAPKEYSGHSFRRGSATWAFITGMGDAEIRVLGRWKAPEGTHARYIENAEHQLESHRRLAQGLYTRSPVNVDKGLYPPAGLAWVPPSE